MRTVTLKPHELPRFVHGDEEVPDQGWAIKSFDTVFHNGGRQGELIEIVIRHGGESEMKIKAGGLSMLL